MAKEIWDELAIKRALTRITYEIIEKNKGTDNLVLVGIKTRGVYLAQRIHDRIQKLENVNVPLGELDITLYRDDRHDASLKQDPVVNSEEIGVDINDKNIVFITKYPANDKAYDIVTTYKINRFTGGLQTIQQSCPRTKLAKFDRALTAGLYDITIGEGTGTVSKVDKALQKF